MKNEADKRRAGDIVNRKSASRDWMAQNYYDEWEEVVKSYRCERDPILDEDGEVDEESSSIATPLTNSHVNRLVARITAQPPNVRIRTSDPAISELLSRHTMYAWDQARVQRQQKRLVRQCALFGISPRVWYWHVEEQTRHKFVDPLAIDPAERMSALKDIDRTYDTRKMFGARLSDLMKSPDNNGMVTEMVVHLLKKYGRDAQIIKVIYAYQGYAGPKCDLLSVADYYPEPNYEAVQKCGFVILERRRDKSYLRNLVKVYPQMRWGMEELFRDHKDGSKPDYSNSSGVQAANFRSYLARAYNRDQMWTDVTQESTAKRWTITEEHVPGRNPKLRLVAEDSIFLGEIPYPYDLNGKIAITDCVLMDDILGGVGDSNARFGRGIQKVHDRAVNTRWDLVDRIARPLVGTTNRELYDDPSQLKRGRGFRLVKMKGPNDMWQENIAPAAASAQASLANDPTALQNWQLLTGESNLSQGANIDPQQNRTATGARILAYAGDVITKDLIDMFTQSSLIPDVEMICLLQRSEMTDASEFRFKDYSSDTEKDPLVLEFRKQGANEWVQVEPYLYQRDDLEVEVEAGSTLADDDEAKVQKADHMFQIAVANPNVFSVKKAATDLLVAMGKGREIDQWMAPPAPPPAAPPPAKASISISLKGEDIMALVQLQQAGQMPEVVTKLFASAGVHLEEPPPAPGAPAGGPPQPGGMPQLGPGAPPPAPPGANPGGPPPPPPLVQPTPEAFPAGASASLAARGRSPFGPHKPDSPTTPAVH